MKPEIEPKSTTYVFTVDFTLEATSLEDATAQVEEYIFKEAVQLSANVFYDGHMTSVDLQMPEDDDDPDVNDEEES